MSKREKKPDKGLSFPTDQKGERSTTIAGKNIVAAAIRGAKLGKKESSDETQEIEKLALACEKEKNWRFKYHKHFMNMVKVSAKSPEAALGVAEAGINYMHSSFEFVDPSDPTVVEKFDAFMQKKIAPFHTAVIDGEQRGGKDLVVPYKGSELRGEKLMAQLDNWQSYGTIESDAASALIKLIAKGPVDLTGQHFVLIGAGSAMGPFIKLLEYGATVIAIDIPGAWGPGPAKMWQRLIDTARKSSGKLIFPVSEVLPKTADDAALTAAAGCNLTEQPSKILAWLETVAPGSKLTIGNYTYLDGDLHVKLSLAADAVIKGLAERRPDTAVAFLCTPTDIHFITDEAYFAAKKNFGYHPGRIIEAIINMLSFGKLLKKNALKPITAQDGSSIYLVDGLSVAQGPNYALAKRLQHWRAIVAYNKGHTVSSNIAPSTATLSVVSNRTFAWAYGGMPYFKPYEIFQQETTNAVMAAMLIADVTLPDSPANPVNKEKYGIKNPLELFKFNSVHGGVWRAAYQVDSIGEVSALIYFLGGPSAFLPVCALLLAGIVVLTVYFLQ